MTTLPSKVAKLSFWSQKLRNILKCMRKNNFPFIFNFFVQLKFHFKLLGLSEIIAEKSCFFPISMKLRSAYVSEDSKKTKTKFYTIFIDNFFLEIFLNVMKRMENNVIKTEAIKRI